jgi:acyl transferase domain-containing protein
VTPPPANAIAVVGLSALFPGSVDETGFWNDVLAGRDLIRDVPPTHWLKEDYFDADPGGAGQDLRHPRRLPRTGGLRRARLRRAAQRGPATDTAQLLALIVAQRVLEEVGAAARPRAGRQGPHQRHPRRHQRQELLSSMASRLQRPVWVKALREAGLPESKVQEACDRIASHYVPWQESTFPGLLGNVVAGRIANRFDTGGTNCVTDAACASSFAALSMAVNELVLGQSDLVVTGGVDTLNDIFMYMCFAKTQALSRAGDCRPFSDEADGTLLGEGLAISPKAAPRRERDGDRVYPAARGGLVVVGRAKASTRRAPRARPRPSPALQAAGYGRSGGAGGAHGTGPSRRTSRAEGLSAP